MSEEKKKLSSEEARKQLNDQYEEERAELLRRSKENKHVQLQLDGGSGVLKEVDEIRQLIGQQFEKKIKRHNLPVFLRLQKYLPKPNRYLYLL
ncbi:hypothetical protein [Paraflavitalea speifideaquila]|uniref:hypothetical protein n=1 Tax=Paraflavitalea speifideaquila TaxID=3076558 RepID=UPI0028F0F9E5|nr:hypothetical protein [Paraflavitalea speifideiaquila]